MRSNFYAIIFLAITASSALGAAVDLNPNSVQNPTGFPNPMQVAGDFFPDTQSGSGIPTDAQNGSDFLPDTQNGTDTSSDSQDGSDTQDGSDSQDGSDFLPDTQDGSDSDSDFPSDFDDGSDFFKRSKDCSGGCPNPSYNVGNNKNSNNPQTSSSATNKVNNAGANSHNNYFGSEVNNNESYGATDYAPTTNNIVGGHPTVPVIANPNCAAPCNYHQSNGVLTEVKTNGCPAQVRRGYSKCNVGVSKSKVNGNIVSCSDINIISNKQTKQSSCTVKPSNTQSLITILAFDCSQSGLAGIFNQKA